MTIIICKGLAHHIIQFTNSLCYSGRRQKNYNYTIIIEDGLSASKHRMIGCLQKQANQTDKKSEYL